MLKDVVKHLVEAPIQRVENPGGELHPLPEFFDHTVGQRYCLLLCVRPQDA
jgi:hypothetical protein